MSEFIEYVNDGMVRVKCKYSNTKCSGRTPFKCYYSPNYVSCDSNDSRYVYWTFYIINAKHLIEVKDE